MGYPTAFSRWGYGEITEKYSGPPRTVWSRYFVSRIAHEIAGVCTPFWFSIAGCPLSSPPPGDGFTGSLTDHGETQMGWS